MGKDKDRLLEVFMLLYPIFLYSMALKLFLGIMWMFGGLYIWFGDLHWIIQAIASLVVGLYLIKWRDKTLWNKIWNKK